MLLASALAGAVGGLTSVAYLAVLALVERLAWPSGYPVLAHLGVLAGAGLLICILLVVLGDPGDTGVLIDSVHETGGPPTLRPLLALVPVSLIGIGAGGGLGPEPVLMQTTGTISTWIGRRLGASTAELRILTVTGMASGLTVLFAAPLGAAVFALEILHRKGLEYYEALLPACVGSLASFGVYVLLTGRGFVAGWPFPRGSLQLSPVSLLLGGLAGIGGAAVAYAFAFLIRACAWIVRLLPPWVRPPVAGIALGALAFGMPSALTYGGPQLAGLVDLRGVTAMALVLIAAGHLLTASIALSGRWKGGIIIPMFLVGYCLGRAAATWAGDSRQQLVLAAAMMVACNVGMTKTPLGSTLVVAQMTGLDPSPPLLIAALVSLALSSRVSFVRGQRHRPDGAPGQAARLPGRPGP